MTSPAPRLAVRAVILHQGRLLLVNAWPGHQSDLWCAPGGGVEAGSSLPDNLIREVQEETGLEVAVGALAMVNEFHDPARGFHQVEVFFHCHLTDPKVPADWRDPEGIVNRHRWITQDEWTGVNVKPDRLARIAWGDTGAAIYDPLEKIVR